MITLDKYPVKLLKKNDIIWFLDFNNEKSNISYKITSINQNLKSDTNIIKSIEFLRYEGPSVGTAENSVMKDWVELGGKTFLSNSLGIEVIIEGFEL